MADMFSRRLDWTPEINAIADLRIFTSVLSNLDEAFQNNFNCACNIWLPILRLEIQSLARSDVGGGS